jgi:predicted nucleic acid-binding protein
VSVVLDGSFALAWCFDDERTPAVEALLMQVADNGAVVPAIWRLEVANGLRSGIRRGRLDAATRDSLLADMALMDIAADDETDRYAWTTTVALSERYGLTPYDASYLELAQRLNLPLATLDAALRKAAQAAHVALVDV